MASLVGLLLVKSKSKRLPKKNTLDFKGKPMFQWNVEKCLRIFSRTYVSSDSQYILDLAEDLGAIPILRPIDLCGDTPNIEVYKHALQFMNGVDGIVAVQANSPTINSKIIDNAMRLLEMGANEVMTCHQDKTIYGSVWALSRKKLETYDDPYNPNPDVTLIDTSVDIHCATDILKALKQ